MNSIYLFNRSLRLDDNLGLIKCLKESKNTTLVFCVDKNQAIPEKNKHFSSFSLGFMYKSLLELAYKIESINKNICLFIIHGYPKKAICDLVKKHNIDKLYINKDYTPYARSRVEELKKIIEVEEVEDYLLYNPSNLYNKSGKTYKVYTPFLKSTYDKKTKKPIKFNNKLLDKVVTIKQNIKERNAALKVLKENSNEPDIIPGREEGIKILLDISKTQNNYHTKRNFLNYKTSRLSPYIKYGCVSIREVWHIFLKMSNKKASRALLDQLIWREFYYHYYIFYPDELEWDYKTKVLDITNILKSAPKIVQATAVQLITTGFLHNRGRMILAHYLLHEKKLYWKDCERFYANHLTDYDPIVNIGNWLWIKKQPKFKWLNFDIQKKKWDKDDEYITKYPFSKLVN